MDDGTTSGRYRDRGEAAAAWAEKKKERKRQVTMPGESGRGGDVDVSGVEGITAKDMIKRKTDPYSNPTRDDTPSGPGLGGKKPVRPGGPDEGWAGPIGGGVTYGGSTTPFKGTGGSSSGTIRDGGSSSGMTAAPDTSSDGTRSSQGGKDWD